MKKIIMTFMHANLNDIHGNSHFINGKKRFMEFSTNTNCNPKKNQENPNPDFKTFNR